MRTILFLLLPIFAFAQKSEQVKAYLGESKYFESPLAGNVNFVFEKGAINRPSDGKKSFAQLLPQGLGYSDKGDVGRLLKITENGVLIRPYVSVKSAVVPESARNFSVPDSLSFLEQTEQLKEKATFWESQMWQVIKPLWSVVMHFFGYCFRFVWSLWALFGFGRNYQHRRSFQGCTTKRARRLLWPLVARGRSF